MKLSIITINKNNASGLEKTIQSVVSQTYKDFEYLVIDGDSTDGSVEIINKYSSEINYWVSEQDTGIYNAMNKGIRKAQGEYCLFLNSGDCLVSPITLQTVFNEIINIGMADIFYSDMIKSNGTVVCYPEFLTITSLIKVPISHQNSLIKHSLFLEHSLYNEELNIASDWEFFLKEFWTHKSKFIHIRTSISIFDIHGIGSKPSIKKNRENNIIFQNVFQELAEPIVEYHNYHRSLTFSFLLLLYRILMTIIRKIKQLLLKFMKSLSSFFTE